MTRTPWQGGCLALRAGQQHSGLGWQQAGGRAAAGGQLACLAEMGRGRPKIRPSGLCGHLRPTPCRMHRRQPHPVQPPLAVCPCPTTLCLPRAPAHTYRHLAHGPECRILLHGYAADMDLCFAEFKLPAHSCRHLAHDPECRILLRGYAADMDLWVNDYAEAFQVKTVVLPLLLLLLL